MTDQNMQQQRPAGIPAIVFLGWLVPGAGHWLLGQKRRGTIVMMTILATFTLGLVLGGIEMVSPKAHTAWFCAQILTGLPGAAAGLLQKYYEGPPGYGRGLDLGQVYTGVAGLLNVIVILDAVMRGLKIAPREETSGQRKSAL